MRHDDRDRMMADPERAPGAGVIAQLAIVSSSVIASATTHFSHRIVIGGSSNRAAET
jgi:hypothetical protein